LGFYVNCAFDDPELLLLAAKIKAGPSKQITPSRPVQTHVRLRIAYLSPDFHDHPVAHQAVELLERHDKTRFETYGVCLRPGPESAIRQRLRRAFDHFVEAGALSDRDIAQLLADLQIDIAVDLGGYTDAGRTISLSFRPAPIAVNYLGYPGTLGADYIDYLVADALVVPPDAERFYTEKIVRLPDCFLPSDTAGRALPAPPPRAEAGLPETGFVFCAFNNSYKIAPEMFDIWMRLLRAVDGSVLWLSIGDEKARSNLRAEARARQVSSERLVFAGRVEERARHLARLALADLFLDTLPYNAHSTASDMLWAGVPLVTCMGRSFAARVAGSMLTAIGAEELITRDLAQYEALALDLARSPERLAAVRAKLVRNRTSHPLFDTARLCRHLENAYETMWDFHMKGMKPESFMVNRLTERSDS
jgi:predicted O-linked N-acetylglucosamine transferase (SPINDLY family)